MKENVVNDAIEHMVKQKSEGKKIHNRKSEELKLAKELTKDPVKPETMHLIAKNVQENTFVVPIGLYWQVRGRIMDQGVVKNIYFDDGSYAWDDNIAKMIERLKPVGDMTWEKAYQDATVYFYSLAKEPELIDPLKSKLENEFNLLKVLDEIDGFNMEEMGDEEVIDRVWDLFRNVEGEGKDGKIIDGHEKTLEGIKKILTSLDSMRLLEVSSVNELSDLKQLDLNGLKEYTEVFSNFKTSNKSHYEEIPKKDKWKEREYRHTLKALMIWKFINQFKAMKNELNTFKKDANGISESLNAHLDELLRESLEQPHSGERTRKLRKKLKGNLGKVFVVMYAYKALKFRQALKKAKKGFKKGNFKTLERAITNLEENFYKGVKKGVELMENFGTNGQLAEEINRILGIEKLIGEKSGVYTILTNMERFSSDEVGQRWGRIVYCIEPEEMSKFIDTAILKSGRLGESSKPGRTKSHDGLSKFMVIGWKGEPYTVTTTGTLYLSLNIFPYTEVNGEEVTLRIPAEFVFDSNYFSHSFEEGNENISFKDAVLKAIRLITKKGRSLLSINDLKDSIKHTGEGKLNVDGLTGSLSIGGGRKDFLRTLSQNFGGESEDKIKELIELGVITNENGEKVSKEKADDMAGRLGIQKKVAGALSLAYTFVNFYKDVAEAVEGKEVKVDDLTDLEEYQEEANKAWIGEKGRKGLIKNAENVLENYKDMMEKLRLKNVEEKVKVMSNKKIEDVNEKFYGRVEDAINTVRSALNEVAGGIIEMVKNKVGEGWYEGTSLESIRKVINGEYKDSIENEEIKELAEVNKDLSNMVDNCERKGKEGGVNAFKIVDHMESFYSKSTTVIREALKDLKAKVGKDEKNNISNIINELNVEGTFCNKFDSARKKIIEQRDIIYKKIFTSLPSSIEALSLLYRTSIAVQGGKSFTSIPKSSYLGEMALVWNQVLRMFGNEVATTAQNIINTSKWQTRGALQYFLNSNYFLTKSFARCLLMTFHEVWMKKTSEKSSISETGKIIDRVISNENYVIGNVQHRYYKDWTILKRLKYFVGYWFVGKKDFDSKGKELLQDLEKNGEFNKEKLAEAVSTFKRRIAKGKAARISGVMRQILGKVLADSYSQVYAQIQISAAKIVQADNIEDISFSLARLAYAQNIYKEESRAAALMLDAINEIKKVKERKRKFEGKEPLDYTYDNLIDELEHLNDKWKKYNCKNIKKRLERIKKKIGDEIKEKFSEIKALYRTVRNSIVKDKGLFSHFKKRTRE